MTMSATVKPRMICGSRDHVNRNMGRLAKWLVADAGRRDMLIVVGDAPGIDQIVIRACQRLDVSYIAYGIQPEARNGAPHYHQLPESLITAAAPRDRYFQRDCFMAEYTATAGGAIHCVWNGTSPGTERLFYHARQEGYTAYLHRPRATTFQIETKSPLHNALRGV